jgi:alpha-N-arabinofuranosidase
LTKDWAKYTATIQASAEDAEARLVILTTGAGTFCLDTVSLFPQQTFHDRPNGLRADLAQVIARFAPEVRAFSRRLPDARLWSGQYLPLEEHHRPD